MDIRLPPWSVALLTCLLLSLVHRIRDASRRRLPGPTRLPFFGNALQLPRKRVWMKLAELAKTYGTWLPRYLIAQIPIRDVRPDILPANLPHPCRRHQFRRGRLRTHGS